MDANTQQPKSDLFHLTEIGQLGDDIYQVRFEWPQGRPVRFHAGQYLAIHLPGRDPAWFSIASAPGADQLTLHIQAPPEWESACEVMAYLRHEGCARISMPYGHACLSEPPQAPLLLVVAGTGFAQAKSIVDYLRTSRMEQPVTLYWGARDSAEMYLRNTAERWAQDWPGFHFQPVVCEADAASDCHHERLAEAVLADGHDLARVMVLASGSPAMVYNVLDGLTPAGFDAARFYSDVLEYAPRD
ncbi:CDP-6-deoxy-delta-3,4-glucoseen reductase [Halomonadaceae bacterium KBTZ08]